MKYTNETQLRALVEAFENGTIARAEWRHAEHLAVALWYLSEHDFDAALERMRDGIHHLLRAFRVDFTKENPYHETLTVFWLRTVADFRRAHGEPPAAALCGPLVETFDKDYPLGFYSRERLFSDEARRRFVAPDLAEMATDDEKRVSPSAV